MVYTPKCSIAESTDGHIIIHNDYSKAQSRIISAKLEDWNYDEVTKGADK